MATVQEALEARKKRKEEYEAQKYDVSTAFETYKRRKQSSSESAISDIATRINDEVKAIKYAPSLSWGVGSYEKASKSTSERRSNVKNLTREIESYKLYWDEETYNSLATAVKQLQDGYDSYLGSAKIRENFDSEDSYNLWYKREKEKQDVLGAADFDQYTQAGASVKNPSYKDAQTPLKIFGWEPFGDGEDVNNIVTFAENNKSELAKASAQSLRSGTRISDIDYLATLINEHMTDEEKSIYNYYIGKGDKKKADEYMEYVTDLLKQRQAGKMVEQADGKALELVFSAVAGLDQFASGIKNIDNYITGKEADSTSVIQYAQSEMSSNNEGAWKVANDVVSTTSNMLPSILVGTVTGGVGGIATMTGSAIGNSYAEMRNLGYEDWQAAGYATLVGASEALLQSALGGISKLGGKYSLSAATTKLVSGIDNAFARLAIQVPLNMGSEAVEEMIQTALEPAFKALMTGEEYEAAEWSEIIYSGLLGALSAGAIEGVGGTFGAVGSSINAHKYSKLYGADSQALVTEALEIDPENAHAKKMQGKLDQGKSLTGFNIGHLVESNEQALVSQDKEKIRSAVKTQLERLGETANVEKLSEIISKKVAGEPLTSSEKKLLNNSEYGNHILEQLNPETIEGNTHLESWDDSNNPDALASSMYDTEWAENLETERINAEAYNKGTKFIKGSAKGIIQKSLDGLEAPDDEEKESEGKYKVSESGDTIYNGTDVNIEGIASIESGDIKVKLDNGETVSAKELSFSTAEEAAMYNMIARMEVSAETANELLSTFKPTNSSESLQYLTSVPLAYKFGKINYEAGLEHIKLSEELKRTVYNRGRIDATLETKTNPSATSKGKSQKGTSTKKNGIIFEKGVTYNEGTANDLQKASMAAIEAINAISNLEVHVFESKVENGERVYYLNGKREVAPNGFFRDGNKIYIDLNAGNKGEGAMLYTMAHEVTHYIRKWNAKGFKELADFLIEQYGKKGVPVNALIEAQKAKIKQRYKREGKTLPGEAKLYDMAYEEMVADAMSDMLADEKAYEKLAKLKQQNKSLWKKLGEAIKHILDKLKAVIGLYSKDKAPVAQEAYFVREFAPDVYDKLQDLYLKAFVEADNNYSSAEETLAENGIVVNPDTESASLLSVRDVLGEDQRQKVAAALATRFGVTKKEAMDWLKAETSMASLILNPKYSQYLDYNPDPNEVAIKQNSDYPQGTVDFSPICAKRREFTSVMNNILRLFPNHVFAATDLAKIRSIMQEEGMTIPCGICYVEDRRQLDTIVAQNFIDSLKLYREGSKTRPDGKAFNANQLKGLSLTDGDTYTPSVYELVSLEGLNVLKEKNPNMAEAWVKFNNARGMQSVRLLANEAEYKRQILKYDKRTVKSKNDKGGLRVYSFSDAEMFHLIDIIQVITDSATVGLSLQGYTKVNEYARAVKDTGEKLNRSLIPKGELGYHIENGKVVLDYDTVEGIDINHPDFFDNRDNPNVGNITIGVSDVQIRAAMVSDFVDQIIPFHTGQSEEVLGEKGISTWSNYKDFQTEKDIATGKVSDHQINIYTEVLQVLEKEGKPITKRTFVEKFLQVCKDNGLTPRFSQFLNTNENGEYVYTEGYHKMLVDFKTFAQTEVGEYLPQMPVKPIFDNEYITGIMKDYVKSQKVKDAELAKSMPKVIERITNEIVKPSDTQFSDRDSYSYETLTSKPNMKLTAINNVVEYNKPTKSMRVSAVNNALKNARAIGTTNSTGGVVVYVDDIGSEVVLSRKSLEHGLDRRFSENLPATLKAGEILKNAIRVNELTPKIKTAKSAYVLIGAAKSPNGDLSIVEFVVNEFTNEVDTIEVLKSVNTKKEEAVLNAPPPTKKSLRITSSDISIADLLDFVNSNFPDVLSESVLRHFGHTERPDGVLGESALYSDRDSEGNELTAEQQKFFKDSKVRDKKGNLMVMYHGTTANFNTFKKGDVGFHFGTKGAARGRVGFGKNVTLKEVYLNITNPIVFNEDLGSWDADYRLTRELLDMGILTQAEAESVLLSDDKTYRRTTESANKKLSSMLLEKGYDGIAYSNTFETKKATTSYIAFNSNQAKDITNKAPTSNPDMRYSERDTDAVSNRTLLANALESTVQNDIEKNKLDQYKKKIALIESEQAKLDKNRSEAETLRFKKGRVPSETKRLRDLDAEATQLKNRITTYDKQLLNLEATTALKNVLAREKEMVRKRTEQKGREALASYKEKAAKTQKELLTRWQESRHKAVEGRNKTAMKHKIKNVVSDLNKLLLNPTKEQHVPIGLQKVVAEALDAINMDTMNAEERVTYYNDLIAKSSDPDEIAMLTKKRDFFEYRDANFKDKITALKNAYAEFKESEDPLVKNAHNEAIENLIKNVADEVGNKSLKDMSLSQLEAVYDMYKAVLATVRNSNKLFKEGKKESISETSESVKTEVKEVGGHKDRINKLMKTFKKFGWNMLKPVTAMKVIGSNTFEDLFANVRAGEDTWAVDVNEAKEFYEDKADKYKYNKWDFKKRYTFKDSAGNDFSLSLEQIMSLYAYSKREQADQHLEVGGFVFDDSIEVVEKNKLGIPMKYEVNDANPYRLRKEDLATVISSLTSEQKGFVDEMQTYLSEVMGAKGNEVSLAMYDIKLYKEVNYFPLKTSRYFREFDPEKSATPKIRNAGFSKKTIPNAGNPIVLSNFMDVWANHVNEMSMYHAFVLPLEDFMRVYNYSSTAGGYDSVQQYIKNAYGAEANLYIEKLMDDLNGGARVDSTAGIINKGLALFKKSAVFASASVVIQQPSAIARAFAYINPKYFAKSVPSAMNLVKHKELWKEVKKYAPVAVIKEMGYFDTGMGRSTVEWIKGNRTIRAKVDDVLSKAPAIADELTWTHIWQAVKSEIKATTNLKVGSEEYLKRCGERFTEVVINTQVYDSVLARSGMMRSKDTGMKMATAFMAEPTTTANMLIDGIIQGKRGKLKFLGATVGAVSSAIILNSILVSLVYAARDDDEDETFAEKYITSLTSELLDGFNPLTYIPFVKDIWSILQGFDVERADMTLVTNFVDSLQQVVKVLGKDTDDMDEDELNEYRKDVNEAVLSIIDNATSLLGVPIKNIRKDINAIINTFNTIGKGDKTTEGSIKDAIGQAAQNALPIWGWFPDESKGDKLYDAIIKGDKAYVDRLKSGYKSESEYESAVRKALRENDSRIKEAAQARYEGNISEYTRIAKEIIAEGNFSQDTVVGAINAEISAIKNSESTEDGKVNGKEEDKDEATSIYKASDINDALESGDTSLAKTIINDLVKTKVANGMTEKEAKSSLRSSMTSYWKPLYKQAYSSGNSSEMARIRKILYSSGLYGSADDVVKSTQGWLKD